jgi:hypothetical protein
MTEPEFAAQRPKFDLTENLRARFAAVVREDLAAESAAGFPLLRRFPNSEVAGVPDYVSRLTEPDRGRLIDALAHYSTLWWSHEMVREKKAHPILGPYLARSPSYPAGDWYGGRPKKSLLKTSVINMLTEIGYARKTIDGVRGTDVVEYRHPDSAFAGRLIVHFDSSLMRQMEFGFRDWLNEGLSAHFRSPTPREFIPIVGVLAYDHLWHGAGVNNPVCWDLITEDNLAETLATMRYALERLTVLGQRINDLSAR